MKLRNCPPAVRIRSISGAAVDVMFMAMALTMGVAVIEFDRNDVQSAMANFGFGHQGTGEFAHFRGRAAQYERLNAVVVIEVNVHYGKHNIVIGMLQFGESLCEVARMMVINVGKRSHTKRRLVTFDAGARKFASKHVAHRFGTVLIAALAQQLVKLAGEVVAQGNCESFHIARPGIA